MFLDAVFGQWDLSRNLVLLVMSISISAATWGAKQDLPIHIDFTGGQRQVLGVMSACLANVFWVVNLIYETAANNRYIVLTGRIRWRWAQRIMPRQRKTGNEVLGTTPDMMDHEDVVM